VVEHRAAPLRCLITYPAFNLLSIVNMAAESFCFGYTCAMAKRLGKPPGAPGRARTGIAPGERVSDYQRMTIRLPANVRLELRAAAAILPAPEWRVIVDAIRAYVGTGPGLGDEQRKAIRAVVRARGKV
jgi:hypothetical protein